MSNILTTIIEHKQQQNLQQAEQYPLASYQRQLQPSERSLYAALNKPDAGFILECKKASPSKGLLRKNFDPVALARSFQPYAAAISVLTEPEFFQGCYEYLSAVSAAVNIPVLCKDFFVEPEQVYRARLFGADAVLLMLSVLSDEQYRALATVAESLQLDVLTEVANEAEMRRAAALGAKIIGINHRDLTDLSINPRRSAELAPLAPSDALLVAESGFDNHAAIRQTAPYVDGFLVGSALSAASNTEQAIKALLFGKHKVCGITREADAMVAAAAGAYYAGLIFVSHSSRCVDIERANAIIAAAPQLHWVGVFADQAVAEVCRHAHSLGLAAIQLHGHEDIDYVSELRKQLAQKGLAGVEIWKALDASAIDRLPDLRADKYLLDNGRGGTGQSFDWAQLQQFGDPQALILAGGIGAENVTQALNTGVSSVDMNSALEFRPGQKHAAKIRLAFQQIRQYGRDSKAVPLQEVS